MYVVSMLLIKFLI